MVVIKRDGRKVPFSYEKIENAVLKAFRDVDGEVGDYASIKARDIAKHISLLGETMDVETIQNIVEEKLMASNRKDVARAYVIYRNDRNRIRAKNDAFNKILTEKITASNVENQNANVDEHSFGGRIGSVASETMKRYALDYCMSDMMRNNHLSNEIYVHDLDHYAVGDHNCYLRSTRFITSDGIKSFDDFSDGDTVSVLTKDGEWKDAVVHCYGRQPMFEITLERCGESRVVVATRNHRWLLSSGEFTDNIEVGDALYPLHKMDGINLDTRRKAEMFALGFILGDGYDHKGFLEVKFCTPEKESYIEIFDRAGYSIGVSNGYKYARKKSALSKQEFLSNKLWKVLSFEDKRCVFEGYMYSDGSKTTNTKYAWTSDSRMCDMIEDISALNGYHIFKKKEIHGDTEYKQDRILYQYVFTTSYGNNSTWKVVDIKKGEHRNKDYEAWCLEEPFTHTFTLEGGIVTGNCLSVPFDKLLANGFNTRQTDVRPAQSINTAFQLVAVIFQLQSLQQFGGVSATHLDWTMVPYVRKSFNKHYIDGIKFLTGNTGSGFEIYVEEPISSDIYKAYNNSVYKYAMEMTEREVYQAAEGLFHNLNTLQSRSGNQLPFTSINFGTCTLEEGRMVTRALLEVSIKGIGKMHKTPIFPCSIFQVMKGVNREPNDPNYDLYRLALKSTAQRLYPNYANVDWSGNAGYDVDDPKTYFSTMGK